MNRASKSRIFAQSLQKLPKPTPTPVYIQDPNPFIPQKLLQSLKPEPKQVENQKLGPPKPKKLLHQKQPKFQDRNEQVLRELVETDFSFMDIGIERIDFANNVTRVFYSGKGRIDAKLQSVVSKRFKSLVRGATKVEFVPSNNINSILDLIEKEQTKA